MDYRDWADWFAENFGEDTKHDDKYASYYFAVPKKYNWTIESTVTTKEKQSLENTYKNDDAYKNALKRLMDEIDGALKFEDQDWFKRASKEYKALKMEGIR